MTTSFDSVSTPEKYPVIFLMGKGLSDLLNKQPFPVLVLCQQMNLFWYKGI